MTAVLAKALTVVLLSAAALAVLVINVRGFLKAPHHETWPAYQSVQVGDVCEIRRQTEVIYKYPGTCPLERWHP